MDKEATVFVTDAEIDAAMERGRALRDEPRAVVVRYLTAIKAIVVLLSNDRRLLIPVEELQGLNGATVTQLRQVQIHGGGTGISFPAIDADFYVPSLINRIYGNKKWMAQLGKKGGAARTTAKQEAARLNGAKGGRPKKKIA